MERGSQSPPLPLPNPALVKWWFAKEILPLGRVQGSGAHRAAPLPPNNPMLETSSFKLNWNNGASAELIIARDRHRVVTDTALPWSLWVLGEGGRTWGSSASWG